MFCPGAGLSLQIQHSPLYPLISLPFHICLQSIYHDVVYDLISSSAVKHPSAGSFFLASGPVNFFSSSLPVPALFFLLPVFPAQLDFSFLFIHFTFYPSFSISTSQMLPGVYAHSVVVSKSLHHRTLRSTQSTSLDSSLVLFQGPAENGSYLLKTSFAIAILCFTYDSSSCCYWYYTSSIWNCPLVRRIHT